MRIHESILPLVTISANIALSKAFAQTDSTQPYSQVVALWPNKL